MEQFKQFIIIFTIITIIIIKRIMIDLNSLRQKDSVEIAIKMLIVLSSVIKSTQILDHLFLVTVIMD